MKQKKKKKKTNPRKHTGFDFWEGATQYTS
jgi:hypothetical protein